MFTEDKINSNYAIFIEKLNNIGINTDKLINYLGENNLKKATYAPNSDSGMAFDGSLIYFSLCKITKLAVLINNNLFDSIKINQDSLIKVCLLHQISKAIMFEPNDSQWEKANRGILYKYKKIEGALRCGERSAYICLKCGIDLTPEEFEAIRIIDKDSDDNYAKYYSSPLSIILKSAIELTMSEARINNLNK